MIAVATEIKPRTVFCVIADEYKSAEIANDACEGCFTIAGKTVEFEGEIDWFSEKLPSDEEWRIEWSKFYFGLDMANAFLQNPESKYPAAWQKLVSSWIDQVTVDHDSTDVAARRIQNWIYAWNIFESSHSFAGFGSAFEERLLESLSKQIDYLQANLTPERNHRTLELYALFIYPLAFPEANGANELLRFSISELEQNIKTDILPDGVHRENSTHYHCIVLRSLLGALENAKTFGVKFSQDYMERLEKACEFAMYIHRPDGEIPALSDSDSGSYLNLLELAAKNFPRPDFLYAATKGKWGLKPEKTNVNFETGGYYVQRSGWGNNETAFENERFLIFDCGRLGDGGHGHYDLLNFEAYANGSPLIVDPGRYTYAEENPNLRHWFKGTKAHNTVCVDGADQTPYRRGKPKGETAQGKFIGRFSSDSLDVLIGEARSPVYDAIHTRHIFFVRNEYWVIWDKLRAASIHTYDLRYQLHQTAWNHTTPGEHLGFSSVRTADFSMLLIGDAKLAIERGWVAPEYGIKLSAPRMSFKTIEVNDADFFTLIFPQKLNETLPKFKLVENPDSRLGFLVNTDFVSWDKTNLIGYIEQKSGGLK